MIGWIVSGVILLLVIAGMIWALGLMPKGGKYPLGAPTEMTTGPGKLDKIVVNLELESFMTPPPAGTGAERMYNDLVKLSYPLTPMYDPSKKVETERLFAVGSIINEWAPRKGWNRDYDNIVDLLVKAADTGYDEAYDMLFPDIKVDLKNEFMVGAYLKQLGRLAVFKALQEDGAKRHDEAAKYWRAALIYGDRLARRGLYVGIRRGGYYLCTEAMDGLKANYAIKGDKPKADIIDSVLNKTKPAMVKFHEKTNILMPRPKSAGDLWNLAENDKDVSWRLAGVMWLGYMKYERGVNEPTVNAYLDKKTTDKESIIADKAKDARAFTLDDAGQIQLPLF